MEQIITSSQSETKDFAKKFVVRQAHHKHLIVALTGELGSGKTAFVQGFAKGLGIKGKIISPTFVLIRQHLIPKSKKILYHIDFYRLEGFKSLKELGLEEILSNHNALVLIEWAEKAEDILPKNTLWIKFENLGGNKRKIILL